MVTCPGSEPCWRPLWQEVARDGNEGGGRGEAPEAKELNRRRRRRRQKGVPEAGGGARARSRGLAPQQGEPGDASPVRCGLWREGVWLADPSPPPLAPSVAAVAAAARAAVAPAGPGPAPSPAPSRGGHVWVAAAAAAASRSRSRSPLPPAEPEVSPSRAPVREPQGPLGQRSRRKGPGTGRHQPPRSDPPAPAPRPGCAAPKFGPQTRVLCC